MIFSGCGAHLHCAMESNGNNSRSLGADRGIDVEWGAATSGGGIRVDTNKDVYMLAFCSRVPQELVSQESTTLGGVPSSALQCETAGFWSSFGFPALPSV